MTMADSDVTLMSPWFQWQFISPLTCGHPMWLYGGCPPKVSDTACTPYGPWCIAVVQTLTDPSSIAQKDPNGMEFSWYLRYCAQFNSAETCRSRLHCQWDAMHPHIAGLRAWAWELSLNSRCFPSYDVIHQNACALEYLDPSINYRCPDMECAKMTTAQQCAAAVSTGCKWIPSGPMEGHTCRYNLPSVAVSASTQLLTMQIRQCQPLNQQQCLESANCFWKDEQPRCMSKDPHSEHDRRNCQQPQKWCWDRCVWSAATPHCRPRPSWFEGLRAGVQGGGSVLVQEQGAVEDCALRLEANCSESCQWHQHPDPHCGVSSQNLLRLAEQTGKQDVIASAAQHLHCKERPSEDCGTIQSCMLLDGECQAHPDILRLLYGCSAAATAIAVDDCKDDSAFFRSPNNSLTENATSCADVKDRNLCHLSTYSYVASTYCPLTCGIGCGNFSKSERAASLDSS